jgi:hypothetical protein
VNLNMATYCQQEPSDRRCETWTDQSSDLQRFHQTTASYRY